MSVKSGGGGRGVGGTDLSILSPGQDLAWLIDLLRSVQLEQFYVQIRDELQMSRLEHFEFVAIEDLEKVRAATLELTFLSLNIYILQLPDDQIYVTQISNKIV